jgi:hypothetical protein
MIYVTLNGIRRTIKIFIFLIYHICENYNRLTFTTTAITITTISILAQHYKQIHNRHPRQ